MTLAEGGIDLFIPEVYDIVWSLIILVAVVISNLSASSEDEQSADTPVPEPSGEVSG